MSEKAEEDLGQERVACAALRHRKFPELVICSPRHGGANVVRIILALGETHDKFEQGFVTNKFDRFVTRQEAWKIAEAAGQIRYRCGGDTADGGTLYSENLY